MKKYDAGYVDGALRGMILPLMTKNLRNNKERTHLYIARYLVLRTAVERDDDEFLDTPIDVLMEMDNTRIGQLIQAPVNKALQAVVNGVYDAVLTDTQRRSFEERWGHDVNRIVKKEREQYHTQLPLLLNDVTIRMLHDKLGEELQKDLDDIALHPARRYYRRISFEPEITVDPQTQAKLEEWSAARQQRRLSTREKRRKKTEEKRRRKLRDLELHKSVLTAIPEHYRDFYPMARAMHRRFILHIGPTNSGKTYQAIQRLENADSGVYLGPLRLLAYEQYEKLNRDGVYCSLVTGEEQQIVPEATIQASTIEMADLKAYYQVAVIDEAQLITDPERGGAWTAAMLGLCAEEIHVCASPDAKDLLISIIEDCGDSYEVVEHERKTKLVSDRKTFHFPDDVQPGDALIVFSRRSVHAVASALQDIGWRCSVVYGALPYDVRHEQARLFENGTNEIVVATDAIGLGMNLPIKRVVFLETDKFDGQKVRQLRTSEIKQIAGRAGRYGIYSTGHYTACEGLWYMRRAVMGEYEPVGLPVITFPESLLVIDAPLQDLLDKWNSIDVHQGWNKASTQRMLSLLSMIDPDTDKKLQYDLVTMAFDEENETLRGIWREMAEAETEGVRYDISRSLPQPEDDINYSRDSLDELEQNYRICDLLYTYLRKFYTVEKLMEEVGRTKAEIAAQIIHILESEKLPERRCRRCGKILPWNYGYSTCERCFRRIRRR